MSLHISELLNITYAGQINKCSVMLYTDGYLWVLQESPASLFRIVEDDLSDFDEIDFGVGEEIDGYSLVFGKDYLWLCHPDKIKIYQVDTETKVVTIFEHTTDSANISNVKSVVYKDNYLYFVGKYNTGYPGICKVDISTPATIVDGDYTFEEYTSL